MVERTESHQPFLLSDASVHLNPGVRGFSSHSSLDVGDIKLLLLLLPLTRTGWLAGDRFPRERERETERERERERLFHVAANS